MYNYNILIQRVAIIIIIIIIALIQVISLFPGSPLGILTLQL